MLWSHQQTNIKSLIIKNNEIKFVLTNANFLKGKSVRNEIQVKFDLSFWEKNSVLESIQTLQAFKENQEGLFFITRYNSQYYYMYPKIIQKKNNIDQMRKYIIEVLTISDMIRDDRIVYKPVINPAISAKVRENIFSLYDEKSFENSVSNLINFGHDNLDVIFTELDNFDELDRKFWLKKHEKKKGFNYKYSPRTYFDVYDFILYEIFGFKPYYPIGNPADKISQASLSWKTFIWIFTAQKQT